MTGTRPPAVDGRRRAEGQFYLPELPRLLPYAYHPKAAQIEFRSNGWVRRFLADCFADEQELLKYLRQRNGLYGSLTVPTADEAHALNVVDFYQFVTVIDDLAMDPTALGASQRRLGEEFARILEDFTAGAEPDPGFPYGCAACDLWRRIGPGLSPRQADRFSAALRTFLDGTASEFPLRRAGAVPDYASYMTWRPHSFGFDFMTLLTEYAIGVDMSPFVDEPSLRELHAHGVRQLILVNDLLSWRTEHSRQDTVNALRVLCQHEGLTLQQTVNRVCRLVEYHERSYLAAREAVCRGPLGTRADVRTYLDGLDRLIGGSQEFEYLTPRYFGDGYVWDGATSGWISLAAPVARLSEGRQR
ncbi:hypothetical protein LRS74_12700 [Streptomyces sp. LX-29]|uniref:terpene synthase family protein n=1 Tax=Streptomyces sp. LX-29 TaxID=2900152 RepID=UPI00240D35DA|nr:hypothetical protein [Streptomyces sp. LX-29]WFB07807.1 hypothetical protein LRS74_12700 [Streptomyces sp. LX-29]